MRAMMDLGVSTRQDLLHPRAAGVRRSPPLHRLPVTDAAAAETILLPMFVGLTDDEQDQVVTALAKCV